LVHKIDFNKTKKTKIVLSSGCWINTKGGEKSQKDGDLFLIRFKC